MDNFWQITYRPSESQQKGTVMLQMKPLPPILLLLLMVPWPVFLFGQQSPTTQTQNNPPKFALVIGNGAYANLARLTNPPNDANDIANALQSLGFTVDRVIDGSLDQMDSAVMRLKNRLSVSKDSYGFFFYAGHGVQSNGENYLIPVDANIPGESFLRSRSLAVQAMLDELNNAGNSLNVVVLDACRDNPFGWARGGGRGLAILDYQPADSIIVYATSAGQTASDGQGRNGLFTSQLLSNLTTPGLEVAEVFRRTGADVSAASKRQQIPAVYNQFFGTAYLGSKPVVRPPSVYEAGPASVATGSINITTVTAGTIQISGEDENQSADLPAWGSLPVEKINAGTYRVVMTYEDGKTEEKTVEVGRNDTATLDFNYRPTPLPSPAPPRPVIPPRQIPPEAARLNTIGGSIGSSFSAPWFIGGIEGTYAPWRYTFFDLGIDGGLVSGEKDVMHYSLYPYARYAFFWPFTENIGWYAGAGGGLMMASYTFPDGTVTRNIWAADVSTGFIFGFGLTVSYSFRTNFLTVSNKLAVGYVYRFR